MATLVDNYLSHFDLEAIEAETARAESLTDGEIAVEIASASHNWIRERSIYALILAILGGITALLLTRDNNWGIYYDFTQSALWALITYAIAYFVWGRFLARRSRRQRLVWLRAFERFGHLTPVKGLAGVLIFVSLQEDEAAIVADKGIAANVSSEFWQGLRTSLVADMEAGNHAEGVVQTIRNIGQEMATHFPPEDSDNNQLPDKPTVIE